MKSTVPSFIFPGAMVSNQKLHVVNIWLVSGGKMMMMMMMMMMVSLPKKRIFTFTYHMLNIGEILLASNIPTTQKQGMSTRNQTKLSPKVPQNHLQRFFSMFGHSNQPLTLKSLFVQLGDVY